MTKPDPVAASNVVDLKDMRRKLRPPARDTLAKLLTQTLANIDETFAARNIDG
jgi:hypothetical protein